MSASTPTKGSVTAEEHVRFLITCIKTMNGGRPDFGKVAAALELPTKGAAAKRYERLLKAYNEFGPSIEETNGNNATTSTKASAKGKRKANDTTNDGEGKAKKAKTTKKNIKQEEEPFEDQDVKAELTFEESDAT